MIEDDILVEHYVDRDSAASLIGNVYLGRVQNVLPSMEAAFIDIGRGRNAVLYAGEVDWDSFGAEGQGRKVERVLKSGQTILVQVTKDPVGAKGARLTNHVSIPGRYIVYAPGGHLSGISRKLPDTERRRLKDILADLVGEASVIVRTAAEGASEEELVRDVNRLKAQWADIEKKVSSRPVAAAALRRAGPDRPDRPRPVHRGLLRADHPGQRRAERRLRAVEAYVDPRRPAPARTGCAAGTPTTQGDLFAEFRLDEQIAKALERKVFLPSGGSLVIDRTEAMTVIDVNTGKFTGSGGNLEATVTSNNLEAAEEIVRQLRLRDIGGIIVIDFIDMVLPANRELLLRRLVECLGRDRTRHQVAEVTSLGLVQMTRKKIGTGLAEAFTTECPHCHGRGVEIHDLPVDSQRQADGGTRDSGRGPRPSRRRRRSVGNGGGQRQRRSRGRAAGGGRGGGGRGEQRPAAAGNAPPADTAPDRPAQRRRASSPRPSRAAAASAGARGRAVEVRPATAEAASGRGGARLRSRREPETPRPRAAAGRPPGAPSPTEHGRADGPAERRLGSTRRRRAPVRRGAPTAADPQAAAGVATRRASRLPSQLTVVSARAAVVVAVIGAGPSGIYAAEALSPQSEVPVEVAVHRPAARCPFGLVRYGVAPDHHAHPLDPQHPRAHARAARRRASTATSPSAATSPSRSCAARSTPSSTPTAPARDRRLGIPGEDLPGSIGAPEFVAWYCGHPDVHPDAHLGTRGRRRRRARIAGWSRESRTAVVVGVGNVALDVARVLVKTADELADTDMADEVLASLAGKHVDDVHVLGRRGPAYTAFTTKELRELGQLPDLDIVVSPSDLELRRLEPGRRRPGQGRRAQRGGACASGPARPLDRRVPAHPPALLDPADRASSATDRVTGVELERTVISAEGYVDGTGELSTVAGRPGGPLGRLPRASRCPGCPTTRAPAASRTPRAG